MDEKMKNTENSSIPVVTAIYMFVLAIISICGSLVFVGLGSFLGQVSSELEAAGADSDTLGLVGSGGALTSIIGILTLVVGIAILVMAVGLLMRKSWSWGGTIAVNGVYVVLIVLGWIAGGGFDALTAVFAAISAIIVYLFLTNDGVKRTLGQI